MRANISVVMSDGTVLEGAVDLRPQQNNRVHAQNATTQKTKGDDSYSASINFESGPRPFIKRYGQGLSGPEKLILLVAYFAKGAVHEPVARFEVVSQWGKMKPLMGGKYNGAYDTRARDSGWLRSTKPGVFELCPGWESILNRT